MKILKLDLISNFGLALLTNEPWITKTTVKKLFLFLFFLIYSLNMAWPKNKWQVRLEKLKKSYQSLHGGEGKLYILFPAQCWAEVLFEECYSRPESVEYYAAWKFQILVQLDAIFASVSRLQRCSSSLISSLDLLQRWTRATKHCFFPGRRSFDWTLLDTHFDILVLLTFYAKHIRGNAINFPHMTPTRLKFPNAIPKISPDFDFLQNHNRYSGMFRAFRKLRAPRSLFW